MGLIASFVHGWFGAYDDNETEHVSTIPDPCKVRLAVNADQVESNLGAVSFNQRRSDGRHEEYAYMMGRMTADKQAGAVYVAVRPSPNQGTREVLYIDPSVAAFRVPIEASNYPPALLRAPGGQTELHMQGDGNLVTYDVRTNPWTPLWSSMQGNVRDFREDAQYA